MRVLDARDELQVALDQMLGSAGWEKVARPALDRELAKARRQLESAVEIGDVRAKQDRIRFLRRLLEDPRKFFRPDGKEAAE